MRHAVLLAVILAAAPAALPAQGAPPAGGVVTPNAGAFTGRGTLTDNDGHAGTWSVDATLKAGVFTGSATVAIAGTRVTAPLHPRRSYLENGKCYFAVEQDRFRIEFGGPCTTKGVAGRMSGFVPGTGSLTGTMTGTLAFGAAAARNAFAKGVLPTTKLTCAWMERIGGNVAGDLPRYELRFSNMATLTLSPTGTYRTANTSGRFVREGDTIRLTSGQFAGAVGRLAPDKSGRPAVYFERDENRRANGVHIVDPARTSCTVARGG